MPINDKILYSFKVKDELNPEVWEPTDEKYLGEPQYEVYKLNPEVREKLIEIASEFMQFLDIPLPDCVINTEDCDVYDITMTGSLANYNWSEFSDIDLHITLDFAEVDPNEKLVRSFLNAKKTIWNNSHDITVYGYEVELYVQDESEPHFSSGVYSVLYDKWLVAPIKQDVNIDYKKVLSKSTSWMQQIDELLKLEGEMDEREIVEQIEKLKNKLKKFRGAGLEKGGEYSYENLTFKFLRRNGYIKKLFELKNRLLDTSLTL
tara:strand:+ start:247 stop:1032 length:786 start_codon:yes stop_codon:yes gene_type:complete